MLSIIIPVGDYSSCFSVLFALSFQLYSDFELVLIGRESDERKMKSLLEYWRYLGGRNPLVALVENSQFESVARNRNLGSSIATQSIYFFLNDAVLLQPNGLKCLVEDVEEGVFANCGLLYIEEFEDRNGFDLRFSGGYSGRWVVSWSSPGIIRKEDYWAVGGYDCNFYGWGKEDDEMTYRLAKNGFKRIIDLRTWAVHIPHIGLRRDLSLSAEKDAYIMKKHGVSISDMYDYYSAPERCEIRRGEN